jgi:hypothetical protein
MPPAEAGGISHALTRQRPQGVEPRTVEVAAERGIACSPYGAHLPAALALAGTRCKNKIPAVGYHLALEPLRQQLFITGKAHPNFSSGFSGPAWSGRQAFIHRSNRVRLQRAGTGWMTSFLYTVPIFVGLTVSPARGRLSSPFELSSLDEPKNFRKIWALSSRLIAAFV